jgi:cysteine-rich repeat protein
MRANVRSATLAFVLLIACNRPDSDLFGADGLPLPGANSGGRSSGVSLAGSSAADSNTGAQTGADMMNTGGSTTTDPVTNAGTPSTAGSAPVEQGGNAGSTNPPDPSGTAGVPDGTGGSPDPTPTEPVCGNGILEDGEQCDDAGHTGQDGCDASCKVVCSQYGQGTLESDDHHCYAGYDTFEFTIAQQDCVRRGAHLATISSAAENKLARMLTNNSKWIGAYENVSEAMPGTGAYEWLTGEPFTYTNWGPEEPNHLDTHCGGGAGGPGGAAHCYEHCVAILGDGTWADHRCDMSDGYVCEWEPAGAKP